MGSFHLHEVEPRTHSLFGAQDDDDDTELIVAINRGESFIIRYRSGITISGTVVIESGDPSVLAQLTTLQVYGRAR